MSTLEAVVLTAYLSVAASYWLCAYHMDGPWKGTMHAWLLFNVLLWPAIPFVLLARSVHRRFTITRNTAKTAPAPAGAPSPSPESGAEESARGRGGSEA